MGYDIYYAYLLDSPKARDLSVSVCVCVSVCYNREHRSFLSENKKCKNDFLTNAIEWRNWIVLVTFTYFLNVKIC